jgi:outer membrane protein, heavy metal efflux system
MGMVLRASKFFLGCLISIGLVRNISAQQSYTWEQLREKFRTTNPTLRAGQIGIDEARAQEITAYLRPNPDATLSADQFEPFNGNPYRPLASVLTATSISYLHERQHKRELRLESARKGTAISTSQQADLERTLVFNLRNAFVQVLQAKAVMAVAKENLAQYDKVIDLNRERKKAGDIAQVDLDRIELQRVQFESDLQTSDVNLRTAKINLLTLLNDRQPVEQVAPLEEYRRMALDTRPDLRAALETVDKAKTDHTLAIAMGSTDPTFGFDLGRNPPLTKYLGFSVTIPVRIFDRNQGEKLRTDLDIRRNERLRDATESQVFSDVDSAYATLNNTVTLLLPYKSRYLAQATRIRDTISFSYQRGGASLLDFLQAQQEYRAIQVTYLNLVGSYLTAASQLSLAVGREVIQ